MCSLFFISSIISFTPSNTPPHRIPPSRIFKVRNAESLFEAVNDLQELFTVEPRKKSGGDENSTTFTWGV